MEESDELREEIEGVLGELESEHGSGALSGLFAYTMDMSIAWKKQRREK